MSGFSVSRELATPVRPCCVCVCVYVCALLFVCVFSSGACPSLGRAMDWPCSFPFHPQDEQADFEAHMNDHETEKPIAESHFKEQAVVIVPLMTRGASQWQGHHMFGVTCSFVCYGTQTVQHDERKDELIRELQAQNEARNQANVDTIKHLYEQKVIALSSCPPCLCVFTHALFSVWAADWVSLPN